MQRGCVTSLPISPKIARERSVLFAIEANSDGLLSALLSVGSAAANPGDSNNNAAARFARAANGSQLADSLVMDAVTALSAVSSVGPPAAPRLPNIAIARPLF